METKRDFYEALINGSELTQEMKDFASAELAKLDATNAKRRAKAAEKNAVNDEFVDTLVSMLGDVALTASDLKAKFAEAGITVINDKEVSVQKITSLARKAVEAGKAAKTEVKVAKKGTQVGYIAC